MQILTKQGAFDADVMRAINGNFASVGNAFVPAQGGILYLDTVNGSDSNDGSAWFVAGASVPANGVGPFRSMAYALTKVRSNGVIAFTGKIREQCVAPLGVYGVTIIGCAGAGAPRTDLAASWLAPTSPTAATPLLQLLEQGWSLQNFLMTGPDDDACVKLSRRESAAIPDASHATFFGMQFQGGYIHIEDDGGSFNVRINNCVFMLAAGASGGAIVSTSTTVAAPYKWQITNSVFLANVNHIVMPFNKAIIGGNGKGNVFGVATTAVINLTGGTAPNFVVNNTFNITAADFDPAGGVTGVTGDTWSNTLSDAIETGLPAN